MKKVRRASSSNEIKYLPVLVFFGPHNIVAERSGRSCLQSRSIKQKGGRCIPGGPDRA